MFCFTGNELTLLGVDDDCLGFLFSILLKLQYHDVLNFNNCFIWEFVIYQQFFFIFVFFYENLLDIKKKSKLTIQELTVQIPPIDMFRLKYTGLETVQNLPSGKNIYIKMTSHTKVQKYVDRRHFKLYTTSENLHTAVASCKIVFPFNIICHFLVTVEGDALVIQLGPKLTGTDENFLKQTAVRGGVLKASVLLTSQNHTFLLPLIVPLFAIEGQSSFGGLSENVFHILLILCRTLEVELCIHLLTGLFALCVSDGSLIHGLELPCTLFILPEVCLAANEDDRSVPTEVLHLWVPLYQDILKAGGVSHVKAD